MNIYQDLEQKCGGKRSGKNNICGCHRWNASINNRTNRNSNCPFCSSQILCPHNNILYLYPEVCKEWDYQRNKNKPEKYSPGSNDKVWWQAER